MPVAIDFETHLIDKDNSFPKPVCLSHFDGKTSGLFIEGDMEPFLKRILEEETVIAHNANFECGVIYHHFPLLRDLLRVALEEKRIVCTKVYEQLINNISSKFGMRFALDALVKEYFGEDISEDKKDPNAWRLRYAELEGVPLEEWPQKAIDYAIGDSVWAYKLSMKQRMAHKLNYAECVEAEHYLGLMGNTGIAIDSERVDELEREIYAILKSKNQRLIEQGFATEILGGKRPKRNMKVLRAFIEKEVPTPRYTPKKTIQTTTEALEDYFQQTGNEIFKDCITVNTYDKVLTAFISRLKDTDIIKSQYSAVKSTGRTSSSSSKLFPSVNIQQMPRKVPGVTYDIRNCFKPRPGFKLVAIDYAGLELACTAHQLKKTYGRSRMADVINEGDFPADMHSKLACQIMSMSERKYIGYEEFLKNKKKKKYAWYRQLAKPINLGFPGGIGYDTMHGLLLMMGIKTKRETLVTHPNKDVLIPAYLQVRNEYPDIRIARISKGEYAIVRDELVLMKKQLFKLYPELEWFLTEGHKSFQTGEYKNMKNEYGEWENEPMHAYDIFGFKRDWSTYTAVCNGYLMQTPAAIGAKRMVCAVMKKYLPHPGVNPLAFIHDEVLVEVLDNDEMYGIIKDISEIMIDQMQAVTDSVRITVEASAMEFWDKAGGDYEVMYWKDINDIRLHGGE